jgi:hypothetical protein
MGKIRIIKAISSVVKPPPGGFLFFYAIISKEASEEAFPRTPGHPRFLNLDNRSVFTFRPSTVAEMYHLTVD